MCDKKEVHAMNLKRLTFAATVAGLLGLGSLAGASVASADDDGFDVPWVPGHIGDTDLPGDVDVDVPRLPVVLPADLDLPFSDQGPGVLAPPGQIGQFIGVPPGQWNKGPVPAQLIPLLPFCPDLNPGCVNQL